MKSLKEMNNTEKAKLLASLFPEHIQPMSEAISDGCHYLLNNTDIVKEEWDNPILTANFWLQVATDVAGTLKTAHRNIGRSAAVFSDNLFYSFRALISIEYVLRYAMALEGEKKFRLAVQMLFEEEGHNNFIQNN
ncbi:hypothetical protein [Taibaiella koreensis]|uniref:hypothetical protein n=1 Tax=Taibaiella koreensis TaxID=1268548 RepID=UPI0013C2E146|nr:hypothetical protein [Taibaiella koreensis]